MSDVVNIFSKDQNIVEILEDLLNKAKAGQMEYLAVAYSHLNEGESDNGFGISGLQNLKQGTELLGVLELIKTELTYGILEQIHLEGE